jgi:small subunit ribosomal protein S16
MKGFMAVKIRLSRIGKKAVPFYRIVAVDGRKKRDGAYLENLGTYDGLKGTFVQFYPERINDWVAKGAIVTDAVKKLQKKYRQEQPA